MAEIERVKNKKVTASPVWFDRPKMGNVKFVAVTDLEPHRLNKMFSPMDDVTFDRMVDDIKKNGIRVPLIVTADNEIIAGKERYRAAKRAKLEEVPVIVKRFKSDAEIAESVVADNVLRRQLSKSEIIRIGKELEDQFRKRGEVKPVGRPSDATKFAQKPIGKKIVRTGEESTPTTAAGKAAKTMGITPSQYRNIKRAENVPAIVQKRLDTGDISLDLSKRIGKLPPEKKKEAELLCERDGIDKKLLALRLSALVDGAVPKDERVAKVVKKILSLDRELLDVYDKELAPIWKLLADAQKNEIRQTRSLGNKRLMKIREDAGEQIKQ
jgi:hypothetical protein